MTQRQPPLPAHGIGQPVALSGLARLLLALHQADNPPPLKLVEPSPPTTNDEPRRAVPSVIS
jgi:hypothetical protein